MTKDKRMSELGRLGGKKSQAVQRAKKSPAPPYAGSFLDFLDAAGAVGPSWYAWRVFWKAVDGVPLDDAELVVFKRHTGREKAPSKHVREAWAVVGRRGRKSWMLAARAVWRAISRDWSTALARGARGVIPVVAGSQRQSIEVLNYVKGLGSLEAFADWVESKGVKKSEVQFRTRATIEVFTASYKSVRGTTILELLADECAFWENAELGANPDVEVFRALRPGMATVPDSTLLAASSPYAKKGELYRAYQRHYGEESDRVIVWLADSLSMNPDLDPGVVTDAYEVDAVAAASEFGRDGTIAFRSDVEDFLSEDVIDAITGTERELGHIAGTHCTAFVDPSGGSGGDAFTVAIARREKGIGTLVAVRETKPPFSPESVTADYAALLKSYGVRVVVGDRFAGEYPREAFRKAGIEYRVSERTKSELYRDFLPLANSQRVALLNVPTLKAQFLTLERRTARGGRDTIDHRPGARDDVANAVAGALVLVSGAEDVNVNAQQWATMNTGLMKPWEEIRAQRSLGWGQPWPKF